MRLKITMGFAALALGTALVSGTAFAQSTGKAANDGGYTGSPSTPSSRDGSAAGARSDAPHYSTGKAANDGGMTR